jgi:hypothetical protein
MAALGQKRPTSDRSTHRCNGSQALRETGAPAGPGLAFLVACSVLGLSWRSRAPQPGGLSVNLEDRPWLAWRDREGRRLPGSGRRLIGAEMAGRIGRQADRGEAGQGDRLP